MGTSKFYIFLAFAIVFILGMLVSTNPSINKNGIYAIKAQVVNGLNCGERFVACETPNGPYCTFSISCPLTPPTNVPSCPSGKSLCKVGGGANKQYCADVCFAVSTAVACSTEQLACRHDEKGFECLPSTEGCPYFLPSENQTTTPTTTTSTPASTPTSSGTSSNPIACSVGQSCPAGSWCEVGTKCYFTNGKVTCASATTGQICPVDTSPCNPGDTSCIGIDLEVAFSKDKFCAPGSTPVYKGPSMKCILTGTPIPLSYSECAPDNSNPTCLSPNKYGPLSMHCSNSTTCYQNTVDTNSQNDIFCLESSSTATPVCPENYSVCPLSDKNCHKKDDKWLASETNSSNFYCAFTQKCTSPTGGFCIGMNETCPVNANKCSSNDIYCMEAGTYKEFNSGIPNFYYCSSGITFYSPTQAFCALNPKSSTQWEGPEIQAVLNNLGKDKWGLCRPGDACIEPGKVGPITSACAFDSEKSLSIIDILTQTKKCPNLVTEQQAASSSTSTVIDTEIYQGQVSFYIEDALKQFENFLQTAKSKNVTSANTLIARGENILDEAKAQLKNKNSKEAGVLLSELQKLKKPISIALETAGHSVAIDIKLENVLSTKAKEKLAESTLTQFADKIDTLIEPTTQATISTVSDIGFIPAASKEAVTLSIANLSSVDEDKKIEINEARDNIVNTAKQIDSVITTINLHSRTINDLGKTFQQAMQISWCGKNQEQIIEHVNNIKNLIYSGKITSRDATEFIGTVNGLATGNTLECFNDKVSAFKDISPDIWYFSSAQFNNEYGYMRGVTDPATGKPIGIFNPVQATLFGEAVTMGVRLFNFELGSADTLLDSNLEGASTWMYPYLNAATANGIDLNRFGYRMDQPISRLITAELLMEFAKEKASLPTSLNLVKKLKDYYLFSGNSNAAKAVEAMMQYGILKGDDGGTFRPNDSLIRAEFAAINQRLVENLGLLYNN